MLVRVCYAPRLANTQPPSVVDCHQYKTGDYKISQGLVTLGVADLVSYISNPSLSIFFITLIYYSLLHILATKLSPLFALWQDFNAVVFTDHLPAANIVHRIENTQFYLLHHGRQ